MRKAQHVTPITLFRNRERNLFYSMSVFNSMDRIGHYEENLMMSKLKLIGLFAFGLALNPLAYADDHDTIDLAEDGQTEHEYVEHMASNENAYWGTKVSNMARTPDADYEGRNFGQWVSEQVRQNVNHENQRNARAALRSATNGPEG